MQNGFFEFNGGKIYFEVEGEGIPVTFLHGFSLDHRMWKSQVEFLKDKYKIITYDLRGFGKSSVPTGEYSHHEDLKALLGFLKIKKTNLVGLSLGGEVGVDFVLSYPDMVTNLILVDSSLGGFNSTVDWNVHPELGLEKAKENWLNHIVFAKTKENKFASTQLKEILNDYSEWHWYNSDPRKKSDPSALEQIQNIKIPTNIIIGENDLSYYHDIANLLNEKIEGSNKIIVQNSGHMVNLESPEEFNKILLEKFK